MKAKTIFIVLVVTLFVLGVKAQQKWPILKSYDQNHFQRIAMPVGGLGTGTVSLKGNGAKLDWEIMNRPAKGFNPWLFKGVPMITKI
ncbi:hypothetical protein [Maribacter polysaccharolyticus]|uniref:hypothetical protein n=1 Tax=Maribacter polysaccharolyticus TaxID=3020831 RepID=UPI00237F8D6D|nr:hypothetical protein [Maribacter polysaccharolyticus]MDE3742677.1 hypothetical protein [Maribacter polysaccharolyticus]